MICIWNSPLLFWNAVLNVFGCQHSSVNGVMGPLSIMMCPTEQCGYPLPVPAQTKWREPASTLSLADWYRFDWPVITESFKERMQRTIWLKRPISMLATQTVVPRYAQLPCPKVKVCWHCFCRSRRQFDLRESRVVLMTIVVATDVLTAARSLQSMSKNARAKPLGPFGFSQWKFRHSNNVRHGDFDSVLQVIVLLCEALPGLI